MQLRAVHGGVRALTAIGELAGVVQGWITASQGQISRGLAKHLGSRMWAALLCWVGLGWPWVALGRPWVACGGHLAGSGGLWWDGACRGLGVGAPGGSRWGGGACQGRHPAPAPGKSQAPKSIVGIHHRPPSNPPLSANRSTAAGPAPKRPPQHAARAAKLFGMRGGRGTKPPRTSVPGLVTAQISFQYRALISCPPP